MDQPEVLSFKGRFATRVEELTRKTFPPGNHVIGSGLMSRNSIMVVGGPPKSYKSFLLNTILYHLVTATPLFGATRTDKKGKKVPAFPITESQTCLLLEQEVGEEDLQGRLMSLLDTLSSAEAILFKERVWTYSCDPDMRLDSLAGITLLDQIIRSAKPTVVAFDPLIEFHMQEENSASDMAKVMHGISTLRSRHNISSIITHHMSKPDKEGSREGPNRLRGSSVVYGKGDSFLMLDSNDRRGHEGEIKIGFKLRRAKPVDDLHLKLNPDTLRFEFQYWGSTPKEARPKVVAMNSRPMHHGEFDDDQEGEDFPDD